MSRQPGPYYRAKYNRIRLIKCGGLAHWFLTFFTLQKIYIEFVRAASVAREFYSWTH